LYTGTHYCIKEIVTPCTVLVVLLLDIGTHHCKKEIVTPCTVLVCLY
jgi:hypothetical protein